MDSREDPTAMTEAFAERLYGVHVKDFVFDRAREPQDVVVGEGNLDLPKLLSLVAAIENLRYIALEYEGDMDNPAPAMTKCVEAVRAVCASSK